MSPQKTRLLLAAVVAVACVAAALLAIDLGWFGPRLPAISSDPGVPSWVGPDTTVDELVDGRDRKSVGPLYLKWIFLRQTFPSDEAIERLSKYIHDLPCVAEVEMCVPTRGEYHVSVIITPRHGPRGGLSFNSVDEDRAERGTGCGRCGELSSSCLNADNPLWRLSVPPSVGSRRAWGSASPAVLRRRVTQGLLADSRCPGLQI